MVFIVGDDPTLGRACPENTIFLLSRAEPLHAVADRIEARAPEIALVDSVRT
jgi:hypothetical protein